MVGSCSAYGCKQRWEKDRNIRFHRFPFNDPECLKKWIIAVKRDSWQPSRTSVLCGEHFTSDSYKSNSMHFLKDGAVPSIFSFPLHLQKKVKKRRMIVKHTLPVVNDDNGEAKKGGFRRKQLLLDGKIKIDTSKTISSPIETKTLAESIPIEYFHGSEIFSAQKNFMAGIPVIRFTCSKFIQASENNTGTFSKENTDLNIKIEQSSSSVKEIFTYENVLKNLYLIKKPNDFWSISPIPNSIICARWNENYTCEKKLVIDNSLSIRVFLKEKWETNLSELMNITCIDDISNLLEKVESYKIIQFQDLK